MASLARKLFNENAQDIDNLIALYQGIVALFKDDPEPNIQDLDVLFRAAVVLMVSHWEAYVEDICGEALEHLVSHVTDSSKLPKEIKKQVATEVKGSKNEMEIWKLADDGWKDYLKERIVAFREGRERSFNTPKSQNTADFVKNIVGIPDIRTSWHFDDVTSEKASKKLDSLIQVRGQIAHRGRVTQRLDEKWVTEHVEFLRNLVAKTGGAINAHVRQATGKPLWPLVNPRKS